MSNFITHYSCDSLYNITLNTISCSMTEDILEHVLKWYPPSMLLDIIWKVQNIILIENMVMI